MGYPAGAGSITGVSYRSDEKDVGEADQAGREAERITASEGVLFVPFRIVLITPTSGGGRGLRQMVGGTQWSRQERMGESHPLLPAMVCDAPKSTSLSIILRGERRIRFMSHLRHPRRCWLIIGDTQSSENTLTS